MYSLLNQDELITIVNESWSGKGGAEFSVDYFENSYPKAFEEKLLKICDHNISTIIICSSAERCLKIISKLKELGCKCKIGKLFSRHMKVAQQIEFLKTTRPHISVGTPNRIYKLLQSSAFKNVDIIAFDSAADIKCRNILQIHDTRIDVINLLENLKTKLQDNKTKIIIL